MKDRVLLKEIMDIYESIRETILSRQDEFKKILTKGNDETVFAELAFCLLTPQSKAKVCWSAIENLLSKDLLLKGSEKEILKELKGVRFRNKKAKYIVLARSFFTDRGRLRIKEVMEGFNDPYEAREFLVKKIKGMGYKEASHFLRNIGIGEELAILDRHILKNLNLLGVIKMPKNLSPSRYMVIEKKMQGFSKEIGIPMGHLDFVLWFKETGEVFK